MSARLGLCSLLAVTQTSLARPVVLPIAKIGNEELNAVLPNEKILLLILLANAAHIIWALVSGILKSKDDRADKTSEKLDQLHTMVHRMEERLEAFGSKVQDIDTLIELKVLQNLRGIDR